MSYVDIVFLTASELIGDLGYKHFANHGGGDKFAIGTAGYVGVAYFLIRALQGSTLLAVKSAWDGMSELIESFVAIVILGERFDDPRKYLGVALIILGLYFLKLPITKERKFTFPEFFTT